VTDLTTSQSDSLVPARDIVVPEGRNRKEFVQREITDLVISIGRIGLIQPIVITEDNVLIAGERRLRAWIESQGADAPIPVRYLSFLTPFQRRVVELEENLKRTDLTWQEVTLAIADYYDLRKSQDPDFTGDICAAELSQGYSYTLNRLQTAKYLRAGDERIVNCERFTSAFNIIRRETTRALDTELDSLVHTMVLGETQKETEGAGESTGIQGLRIDVGELLDPTPTPDSIPNGTVYRPASLDITQSDFRSFAGDYSGDRFNFLHCDFPYGIGQDRSDQSGHDGWETYEDKPDVFFDLVDVLLKNEHRLLASHSHILLWFSMKYYRELIEVFTRKDFIVNPRPLIWYKSDKRGILPDPERGPRQVYETALLIRKGDRPIVRAAVDVSESPLDKVKAQHYSQKPTKMLRQFLGMFVDASTRMLDPTCGSGTALVVGTELGARSICGLDLEQEYVDMACSGVNAIRLHQATSPGETND